MKLPTRASLFLVVLFALTTAAGVYLIAIEHDQVGYITLIGSAFLLVGIIVRWRRN